jgi:hypothetical protein
MSNASDLLGHTVLEHQHIVSFQRRIVMAKLIHGDDWQAHFLGEDSHWLLFFCWWGW